MGEDNIMEQLEMVRAALLNTLEAVENMEKILGETGDVPDNLLSQLGAGVSDTRIAHQTLLPMIFAARMDKMMRHIQACASEKTAAWTVFGVGPSNKKERSK